MTKLEDKLIASVRKKEHRKPAQARKVQPGENTVAKKAGSTPAASSTKKIRAKSATKAKHGSVQSQVQDCLNLTPSILHPQRIWPD